MRVALYARVSTEEQKTHGISIDAQISALRAWASAGGHEIVGEYVDAGISGKKPYQKRPQLLRFMQSLEAGASVDALIFCKLDRFYRSVKLYYQAVDILDHYKVAWVAVQEDYETVTASGRFKVNIMLAVAENEADRTSERIKAVIDHKVMMGEAITNSLPVGLTIEGKRVVPDENVEAARAVFDVFIRTANTQRARDHLQNYYGISLPLLSIRTMLRNELYIGRYRGNAEYCEPIISKEVFDEAGRILDSRIVKRTPTRRIYLFTGLIICGECGHRMVGVTTDVISYRCNQHYELKRCSLAGYYNEKKLESYLLTQISNIVSGHTAEYEPEKKKKPVVDRAAVQRKLDRLKDLYVEGDIDKEKYRAERDKLTPLLDVPKEAPKKVLSVVGDSFQEDYQKLTRQQKQQLWRDLIDHITIGKDRDIHIFLR